VERITKADHARAVAVAAAHGFNNELTVILSSASSLILAFEPGHPAREYLIDLQNAAERCARMSSGLLAFGARHQSHGLATPFEELIQAD
jgi:signal transduction histidine kinase